MVKFVLFFCVILKSIFYVTSNETCGENEVYDPCAKKSWPEESESFEDASNCQLSSQSTSKFCEGSCVCKPGFIRNIINECISEEDASKCCGPHEYFSCGPACDNVCETHKEMNQTNCPKVKCNPMCYCESGYARNSNNVCIPIKKCERKCEKNEECTFYHVKISQHKSKKIIEFYKGKCVCKPRFVRNKVNNCISLEDAATCSGPHEYFDCAGACDNVCETLKEMNQTNCPIKNKKCNPMCYCKSGYARDSNNICVPIGECEKKCTGPHEYFACGGACDNVCETLNEQNQTNCPIVNIKCNPMCYCESGYARNSKNICVPIHECEKKCTGPHEYFACGGACDNVCETLNEQNQTNCPIVNIKCNPMCYCESGYARNSKNICVPIDECEKKCTGPHEYFACGGACDNVCKTLDKMNQTNCPIRNIKCNPMCYCESGYARNSNNICVPIAECKKKCIGPHEYFACGGACDNVCETLDKMNQTNCPIVNIKCNPMCYCESGYARNSKNICVPIEECEKKCTGPHEYFACGGACDNVCETLEKRNQTNCPIRNIKCNPMCYCESGYARNSNNICVPFDECEKKCTGPHEYFACGGACDNVCKTLDKMNQTNCPIRNIRCNPMCYCEAGYARNSNNICVPIDECEKKCTGPHEYFACGGACDNVCETLNEQNQTNCPIVNIKCNPMCYCESGYARNSKNICVPIDECEKKCTGPHEYFACGGACDNVCETLNEQNQTNCPIVNIKCNPMCYCESGYARNSKNICVPIDECEKKCTGPHEYFACGGACDNVCETLNEQNHTNCPIVNIKCNPMCYCQSGYARNSKNICVPIDECEKKCTGPHEYFACGGACDNVCETLNEQNQTNCPIVNIKCNPMCYCESGYARNWKNICVPIDECEKKCTGPHEYFACGGACDNVCETLNEQNQTNCPIVNINCNPMCYCESGYARNSKNICVPIDECEKKCTGPHEYFACGGACDNVCETLNEQNQTNCPIVNIKCNPMCYCESGYARNSKNICVPIDECEKKCTGPHEYFACGGACDNVCETLNEQNQTNCPIVNIKCNPMCYCESGYARNSKNICVPIDECEKKCTGPHEYFACGGACDNVCETLNEQNQTNCPIVNIKCNPMCYCESGYARNSKNICVPIDECEKKCTGPHEYFACGGACDNVCETLNEQNQTNCPIVNIKCNPMCYCESGYARNSKNICVPIDECEKKCTGPHEYFACGGACDNVCETLNEQNQTNCPIVNIKCNPMCYCESGYARNSKNICVPIDECEKKCTGPHEYFACGGACDNVCVTLNEQNQTNCPIVNIKCNPMCYCESGYARNWKNICVPIDECEKKCTGPHEYFACGGACDNVCKTLDKMNQTNCPIRNIKCNPMCNCESGYARNSNNICVPIAECKRKCTGPHEYFACGGACDNVCETLDKMNQTICPIVNIKCNPMCYCESGYARNSKNICVPIEECEKKCTGPHEYFACGGACDNVCETLNKQNQTNCPIVNIKCNPMCYCESGYARNSKNICVPIDECEKKCTGPHEYFACGGACDNVCETLNEQNQTNCPIVNIKCNPMCYCESGYARNSKNICVPIDECEKKCTDPHEYFACGGACDNVCETLNEQNQTNCPIVNIKCNPMCYCESGYARNSKNICVPIDECEKKCTGPHEYFACGGACDNVCETLNEQNQTNCPIVNIKCNPMCYCESGYARNSKNICVPIDECEKKCTGPHEYFACGGACDNVCETLNEQNQTNCPIVNIKCNPMCYCESGYARNSKNICVPIDECEKKCTGPHEYFACGGACDNVCVTLNEQNQTNCPIVNIKCNPMCYCESGYARNSKNICVPIDECEKKCTGPHEYFACGGACDNVCKTLDKMNQTNCPIRNIKCNPMCYCESGYARNSNNICVPIAECKRKCTGPHEYFACGGACDNVCETLDKMNQTICPIVNIKCNPMCYCESGYARNSKNICVPIEECEKKCTGPHEYFACGGACDNVCETLNKQNQTNCPIVNIKCNPMCYCESGYARNSKNICVPIEECEKKCTGPHEYFACGGACDNVCKTLDKMNQTNCPIRNIKCNPMCYCESRYARNSKNICVPIAECETTEKPSPVEKCNGDGNEVSAKELTGFSLKFLYELVKDNIKANYVMSQLSLLFPLSLLTLYTTGPSHAQLLTALHAYDNNEVRKIVTGFSKQMEQYDQLLLASGVFVDNRFKLNKRFIDDCKNVIDAFPQNIDIHKPVMAAKQINSFVASNTNGTITNLVDPDKITATTRMFLINTVYFKANWSNQFNERNTKKRNFFTSNEESIQTDFMYKRGKISYGDCLELDAKTMEMPYDGGNFKFSLFLPNKIGTTPLLKLIKDLHQNPNKMRKCLNNLLLTPLDLYLPKFKIDTTINLVDVLTKLNITLIFDSKKSGITGISKENEDLYVTDAVHKSFIIVSEGGTEAGSANAFEIGIRSLPRPPINYTILDVNHPFLFFVTYNGEIVFSGIKVR